MIVVYVTQMEEIPPNCLACKEVGCSLPTLKRDRAKIAKKYCTKRHPLCPLKKVDPENLRW